MGIKASEDLHQLIRTMNPAEKRAFRLLSERHERSGGNNYLALFDAIAAQEQYDEQALRRQFAGAAFLKNFSEAKAYLYRSLLHGMRFSRGLDSPETELREVLDHLELLFEKGLFEQAERQLRAGMDRADQLDLHAFTAEFIRWQRRLAKWRASKHLLQEMEALGVAEAAALHHLAIEAQLRDLMGRIQTILSQQADLVDDKRQAELQAIMGHAAMQAPPTASGFHALSSYHYAHAYYHRAQGDTLAAVQAWEAVVATFEAHPAQIKRQTDQYSNALVALIDAQLDCRRLLQVPERLAHLRALKGRETSTVARLFFLEQHLSSRYALVTGHLSEALRRVPELEAGMAKYSKYLSASLEMTMLYNLCALYFLSERYPEAQRYINAALNRPHLPLREDIVDALHLLEMIARYARGQYDVLEHLLRAQERRLRQRTTKHAFSQLAIRFVGRLLAAADHSETKAVIAEMQTAMQAIAPQGKPAGFEELHYWVRSRLANLRIELVLQADFMPSGQDTGR
jgi:hypothetical protein